LFDKLNYIAKRVRRNKNPFGGIQLILSGDMCQLPVIGENKFCFEANSWDECVPNIVYLQEILRQTDLKFQQILNQIRLGKITDEVKEILKSRIRALLNNDIGIKPTRLYPTNALVDNINSEELDKLNDGIIEFKEYEIDVEIVKYVPRIQFVMERFIKNLTVSPTIQLCIGAQVMLLYNMDVESGLVNGSRGIVTDFIEDIPIVKFLNGKEVIIDYYTWKLEEEGKIIMSASQIPLKLAWAISQHKSQGITLDYAEIDLENIFTYGQAYVSLSRVKKLSGISLTGVNFQDIKCHPKAKKFYRELEKNSV